MGAPPGDMSTTAITTRATSRTAAVMMARRALRVMGVWLLAVRSLLLADFALRVIAYSQEAKAKSHSLSSPFFQSFTQPVTQLGNRVNLFHDRTHIVFKAHELNRLIVENCVTRARIKIARLAD